MEPKYEKLSSVEEWLSAGGAAVESKYAGILNRRCLRRAGGLYDGQPETPFASYAIVGIPLQQRRPAIA